MHNKNKTVKFIAQLRHAVQWIMLQHGEVSKYQLICGYLPATIDKFQSEPLKHRIQTAFMGAV